MDIDDKGSKEYSKVYYYAEELCDLPVGQRGIVRSPVRKLRVDMQRRVLVVVEFLKVFAPRRGIASRAHLLHSSRHLSGQAAP